MTGTARVGTAAGVEGNDRLTSVTGIVLIGLLAVEGFTLFDVRGMITLHVYLGVLLVGPILLKCATTIWRFARYYQGCALYVAKGPPHPVLRVLGPLVVVSSIAVLGTGLGLIYTGPAHDQPMLEWHQAGFVVWLGATTLHVLGHVLHAGSRAWREVRDPATAPEARYRLWRTLAVAGSLVIGIGLAAALLPAAGAWTDGP